MNALVIGFLVLASAIGSVTGQSDERALLRQGMKLENGGQIEAAIRVYEGLHSRNSRNTSVIYRLASAYQKVGRFDEAIRILQTRLKLAPGDITGRNRLSDVYFSAGRTQESDREVDRILQLSPNQGTYASVGQRYERRNQDEKATAVYRRARQTLKDPELFARELGQIYERAEKYLSAVREYRTLAKQKPQYVSLVESKLREIAKQAPDLPPLLAILIEGVKGGYKDGRTSRLLVTFAIAGGMSGEALAELLILPKDAPIEGSLLRLGRESLEHADAGDAIRAFEALSARTRNRTIRLQALAGLAQALERSGRSDDALNTYKEVISARSNDSVRDESTFRLGRLLWRTGRTDSAIASLNSMIESGRKSEWRPRAIELLGDIQLGQGCYDRAEGTYAHNVSENRGKEEGAAATYRLARLYVLQKKYARAQTALNRVLKGGLANLVYNDAIELSDIVETGLAEDPAGLDSYADALRQESIGERSAAANTLLSAGEQTPGSALSDVLSRQGIETLVDIGEWGAAEKSARLVIARRTGIGSWMSYTLGLCVENQQRIEEAITIYEAILVDYPTTLEADRARERLTDLRAARSPTTGEAG